MNVGNNSAEQIKSIVERLERINEEKKALQDDFNDVLKEAKGNGFDAKALRAIVRIRAQDANKLAEQQSILDTYLHALGMLADLPLGRAAIERATA
jgi:uncharacterized protein (UPF0335 family)